MPTRRPVAAPTLNEQALGFRVWPVHTRQFMSQAHTHGDIELNWIETGQITYETAGREVNVRAGHACVFWGGVPHQLRESDAGLSGVWVTLPLSWFLQCRFNNSFVTRIMSGEMFVFSMSAERPRTWLADFATAATRARPLLLEMQAALDRLASTMPVRVKNNITSSRSSASAVALVQRVTAFMAAHYAHALSAQQIAREIDLHPKYLMNVFRKSTGLTLNGYLLRLRLAHAQRLLTTTTHGVLDIAMQSGFGSVARFYAVFAEHVGERPLQYRARHATHD
jgi:AraC family transcriptional regulator, melibiose operon regulatory protein